MSYHIQDKRSNSKKSSSNRQKFLKRTKAQVKEAAKKALDDGTIESIADGKKRKINIPPKDLKQHQIHHGQGGQKHYVNPGNKDFVSGDRVARPPQGGGQGGGQGGSPDGQGQDDFAFELTNEEFLDLFFEDLELPDLVKENIKAVETWQFQRSGFVSEGPASRLNIERSMRKSKGRRSALRTPKQRELKKLLKELEQLNADIEHRMNNGLEYTIETNRKIEVEDRIKVLRRKIRAIPFIDDMDLQFNNWVKNPVPVTKAVMFCVMDVSGSMDQYLKNLAKRFFMLLYLFLHRSYEKVDIVFIRHHSRAYECDEQEFFYGRETGGTVVSGAIELMRDIIQERYDVSQWNIYACQASDGDNWGDDNNMVEELLTKNILPIVQYYAYLEIKHNMNRGSDLMGLYEQIAETHDNFATVVATDPSEIYPVFRSLFEKKQGSKSK